MNAAESGQASVRVPVGSLFRRAAPFAARAFVLTSCLVAASAMSDDGVSINIRRSSAGGSFQPPAASSAPARKPSEKRAVGKGGGRGSGERGRPTSETPRAPRPTAETFGDDFSGRSKGRPAPRRHGDGGVTLPVGPGSKPWERATKAQAVRKVEPASAPGAQDKNMARVRYGKAGAANRHDLSTFSVESFSDAALKLLPALVENLEHKFGASNMTHVQKGSVPAILQVHYEYNNKNNDNDNDSDNDNDNTVNNNNNYYYYNSNNNHSNDVKTNNDNYTAGRGRAAAGAHGHRQDSCIPRAHRAVPCRPPRAHTARTGHACPHRRTHARTGRAGIIHLYFSYL
jgi:hypothetical protein